MLVLSRKRNETIVLTLPGGDRVEIMLLDIQGLKVRLGVEANNSVTIHRGEVQAAIDRQTQVENASGTHRPTPVADAIAADPTRSPG